MTGSHGPHFEIYRDHAHEWRWRLRSANGRVIADSGESYTRQGDAERAAQTAAYAATCATYEVRA
jgi:uncharacterized protein YegP (UPF0339 family)